MEKFDTSGRNQTTIAMQVVGGKWWPQTANVMECRNVGGVFFRSENGASGREGCVVNGQMTKASNK